MTLTITQKVEEKPEVVKTEVATNIVLVKTVDDYGTAKKLVMELTAQLSKYKVAQALVEANKNAATLKATLDEHIAESAKADEKGKLEGVDFEYEFGMKANSSELTDKPLLLEILGEETFLELCKVGITDIRKYCTPPQVEKVLKTERSGGRTCKVVEKGK